MNVGRVQRTRSVSNVGWFFTQGRTVNVGSQAYKVGRPEYEHPTLSFKES